MRKARVAIIGGTGLEKLFANARPTTVKTPYGIVSQIFAGKAGKREVLFLPRHGAKHSIPPHKINYRANIFALHELGIETVFATNAAGAINARFKPGDVVVPHDFVDFTKLRPATFYDDAPVTHVDVSQPYCAETRKALVESARKNGLNVENGAVLACTEGPRFETPAEIEMFRRMGCDIVGMTGFPEVVLARELEICYATICYVSNMAAGIQKRLAAKDVSRISKQILPRLQMALIEAVQSLPSERGGECMCSTALKDARFE